VYLRPSLAPPVATAPTSTRLAVSGSAWRLASASFGDADHGTLQFYSSGPAPTTTFLTSDGGKTWQLAIRAPRNGLLVLDDRRLWTSADNGATWTPRLMQAPAELRLARLASAVPGALYALAGPVDIVGAPSTLSPLTLLRSTDGGAHWSVVALPRPPGR